MHVRAAAVFAPSEPDDAMPSKQVIRDAQRESRRGLGSLAAPARSFVSEDGQVALDEEGLYRVRVYRHAWDRQGLFELSLIHISEPTRPY